MNTYVMKESGDFVLKEAKGEPPFNVHREFYGVTREIIEEVKLF